MLEIDVSGLPTSWAMPAASKPKPAILSWCINCAWVSCSSRVRSAMRFSSSVWFSRNAALRLLRCSPMPLSSRLSALEAQVSTASNSSIVSTATADCSCWCRMMYSSP